MASSQEELKEELLKHRKGSNNNKTVKTIIGSSKQNKDRVISAKVVPDTWNKFTMINRAQGMTNNSVINQLISSYVRDNMDWIDE